MAQDDVKRTGVIGLGAMGVQMARHMVRKGFEVSGYDISRRAQRAQSHGVRICTSVADAGKNAEVVFVMVANDEQIHDVIERSGLLMCWRTVSVTQSLPRASAGDLPQAGRSLPHPKGIGIIDVPLVLGQEAWIRQVVAMWAGRGVRSAGTAGDPGLQQAGASMSATSAPDRSPRASNNMLLWS